VSFRAFTLPSCKNSNTGSLAFAALSPISPETLEESGDYLPSFGTLPSEMTTNCGQLDFAVGPNSNVSIITLVLNLHC